MTEMGTLKSQAGDVYLRLLEALVSEDPLGVTSHRFLQRDIETLRSRFVHEGLSFLTKTLPLLGKRLDAGLASMRFEAPREFKRSHANRSIPAFLQTYFNLIFDCEGNLRDDAEPAAVEHLRQVLFFVYKLELPYQPADEARIIEGFIETDKELAVGGSVETQAVLSAASYIIRNIFEDFNPRDIIPRHGPGAVATGEKLDAKWDFSRLYSSIHQMYPYYEYFVVGSSRELIDRLGWYRSLERLDHGRAKVVLVPKDSRGPRLISCEPLEYQWVQQGLGRKMVSHLEGHRLTRERINFTSQQINRDLAIESSISRRNATLDLKDASDRVSVELVESLFQHVPLLLRALLATRTTATTLPDGRVLPLRKFAPMGSALCFPVEATCFWAVIVAAICREARLTPLQAGRLVYVYGDDIIVPTEYANLTVQTLESVGLKVNVSKSCIHGPFRESCGADAFKGHLVTPTRLRKLWSGRGSDGNALASYVSVANQLQQRGYKLASDLIWGMLETTYGRIPYGVSTSGYPCRIVTNPFEAELRNLVAGFKWRWSKSFQRIEFNLIGLKARKIGTKLDGWTRLLRDMVFPGNEDPSNVVIPRSTQTKRGWMAI